MFVEVLENVSKSELRVRLELPNSRAKKYYKRVLKEFPSLDLESLTEKIIKDFSAELITEAKRRLEFDFLTVKPLVSSFNYEGKGSSLVIEFIVFIAPKLEATDYKGFSLTYSMPKIDKEADINQRVKDEFYEFEKSRIIDAPLGNVMKFKGEVIVLDKDSGEEVEELCDREFFDYTESGTFPNAILDALEGMKAGEELNLEIFIDKEESYFFEDYPKKTLVYKIKIKEVYEDYLPEGVINDRNARMLDYKDLADVRTHAEDSVNIYMRNLDNDAFLRVYYKEVAARAGYIPSERVMELKRAETYDLVMNFTEYYQKKRLDPKTLEFEILEDVITAAIVNAEKYMVSEDELKKELFDKYQRSSRKLNQADVDYAVIKATKNWLVTKAKTEFIEAELVVDESMSEFDLLL